MSSKWFFLAVLLTAQTDGEYLKKMERNFNFTGVVAILHFCNERYSCIFDSTSYKCSNQMSTKRLLLLSNSKLVGQEPFEWCGDYIKSFFKKSDVSTILFIPYAAKDYNGYVQKIKPQFEKLGFSIEGIHEKSDPVIAINDCKGIFVGGGNTFLLLKTLYENNLIEPIRKRVLMDGVPYMGASAGSNVATRNICTTNDMPICYPPSFDALNLVPFNINPHYIDPDPNSKHAGETREQRISEYHEQPLCFPVLGLKEGCGLLVENNKASLIGLTCAKLFKKGQNPVCYEPGSDLSFLLNEVCQ